MDSGRYYHIVQRQRSAQLAEIASEPAEILLQILEDGIRMIHMQPGSGRLCGLDEIRFTGRLSGSQKMEQFRNFIPDSLLSEASFSRITIAVEPVSFSLLPKNLFSTESAPVCLEIAGNFQSSDVLFSEYLHPEMMLDFSVSREWTEWASGVFHASEINWSCNFSGLLQFAAGQMPEEDALLAHIGPGTMHVFGRKNGQLCFFNRFRYQTEQDLLYFFLLAMEQSALNQESSPVFLCGSIMSGSAGFEKMNRYAGNLRFVLPPEVISVLPTSAGIRHPQYFDLLSLISKNSVPA